MRCYSTSVTVYDHIRLILKSNLLLNVNGVSTDIKFVLTEPDLGNNIQTRWSSAGPMWDIRTLMDTGTSIQGMVETHKTLID